MSDPKGGGMSEPSEAAKAFIEKSRAHVAPCEEFGQWHMVVSCKRCLSLLFDVHARALVEAETARLVGQLDDLRRNGHIYLADEIREQASTIARLREIAGPCKAWTLVNQVGEVPEQCGEDQPCPIHDKAALEVKGE